VNPNNAPEGGFKIRPRQKELDAWMKQELREQGFRSRPAKPQEMFETYKVLWYWWHPERMRKKWKDY